VRPDGTAVHFSVGASVVANLNRGLREMTDEQEWVWILGDDHAFGNGALMKLLGP